MTLASLSGTRGVRAISAFLVLMSALVLVPGGPIAEAEGTPNISLSKSMPGEALAGDPAIPVTLTATNPTGTDGFNLTYTDVLPAGATFVASDPAPTQILANTPSAGRTTLVWRNVADLQAGVTHTLSYTISAGTLPVGTTITNRASAFVNSDPRIVPTYNTGTDTVDNWTGRHLNVSASTDLVPFILTKTEPGTEAELLRGLHDHQTVYTLEIQNNYLQPTNTFSIRDWIPAGMEYLGCGGDDNSTPGAEEYPGSGRINEPGNAPTLTNPCIAPDLVETLVTNPPGSLPSDVYTRLTWNSGTLATSLGAGAVARFSYVAAIPLRENTTVWSGATPATNGPQGSNIDNNSGPLTEETLSEQSIANTAQATGTYTGSYVGPGPIFSDIDTMTVSAEDLSIHKDADNNGITHGADSLWSLLIETSEYTGLATSLVVTDTLPDGLCPLGAGSPDVECQGAGAPSQPFASATENADGTWTLIWNVADMGRSASTTITFPTETRNHYQESFVDATPVLANDSWINTVVLTGTVDGRPVEDESDEAQSAGPVSIVKEVASRPASIATCGDGSGLTWNAVQADNYRIGDRVCWRLGIDFPVDLDTFDSDIQDYLPPGHVHTAADSWAPGANNNVPAGQIDGAAITAGDTVLTWSVGDGGGFVADDLYFEVVVSSTIVDPDATSSGEIVENLMKYSYVNTASVPFNLRDLADVEVIEPEINLVKGVIEVDGVSTGGGNNVDGVQVMEGDVVTYQITVSNSGDLDADNVTVEDLLPAEYDDCSVNVSSISNGGVCDDVSNRIVWDGGNVFPVAAGATVALTYDVTIPTGIAPNETLGNLAEVTSFTSDTNNGTGTFTYLPGVNTSPAIDPSNVVTATPTIAKTRTTNVDESGNDPDSQATIGELITYTVTVVIPEGTTIYNADVSDDLPANLDLVSSNHTFDGEQAVVRTEDGTADSVTIEFPDPSYTNAPGTGDDTLTLTVVARVIDVPANSRGAAIGNTAEFTWYDAAGGDDTVIDASVGTTVVEPVIGIGKSSVDSIGDDGIVVGSELVDYTLTISNSGAANVSTAHDLVVVDTVPEGVTPTLPIADSGVWVADGTPGDGIGGTITWTIASLGRGASVDRTYRVTVDDPVVVSTAFTNNVVVDATSMAGTPAVERSAGTGYHAAADHTLNTPLTTIAKSVLPTTATIGDIVTYTVDVSVPPGTIMYDATVLDTLPSGMAFDGVVSSSCDMAGAACDPLITVNEIGVIGTTTAAFFLGDIDAPSVSGDTRVVTITYEAHLLDSGVAGNSRVNSASVYGNQTDKITGIPGTPPVPSGFDVSAGPATATITIVEPSLSVDKDVSGQVGDTDYRRALPGETLTYTVVVRNSGGANVSDAHDMTVVDTLPADVSVPASITGGGIWAGGPRTITWTVAGPLAPGASLTFSYDVTVDPTLDSTDESPAGAELINVVDVPSYYGVSAADRAANPSFTFRNYDNVVPDAVSIELDLASIGDYVWFDVNADGVQDPGEPPLAGIDLTVTYLGLNGVPGGGDDEVHVVTTAADGSYLVEDLPGGLYTVVVDTTDLPPGFAASYDLDDGTLSPDDMWGQGPLGEDEDKSDVDFGYTGTGSIGDTIWFDIDADGTIDPSEYGLEGVNVTITWLGLDGVPSADDIIYSATTDAAGNYLVASLPAGDYTVDVDTLTLPAGMHATYDADGIGTANSTALSLAADEDDLDQDFGYAGTGAIGNWVWLDSNGDGIQDLSESGLAGVPVQLTWPGEDGVLGGGDDEVFLTTTDTDGFYLFDNLPPGEYQVDVLGGLPTAADNTHDEDGDLDSSTVVNLAESENHVTADFGYQGTASIGDTVWWDMNGDGVIDAGEPGLEGAEIILTYAGEDGVLGNSDDLSFITFTDAAGSYIFTDLPAGNYQVAVNSGEPVGMIPTYDEDGGLDEVTLVTGLAVGEIHLTADFGYNGTGSIGDYMWLDLNGDGVQDLGEPGIPGVDVDLTWYGVDGIGGTADDVVLSATTDIDGNYLFADLPAGGYDVEVDSATLPPGLSPTFDSDGIASIHVSSLVLGDGEDNLDQDFGYNGGGSVGDTVWFDRDADGVVGTDEYGIAGVDVDVIWAGPDGILGTGDDETFSATTDASGNYLVSSLPPGNYAVVVDDGTLPPGLAPTFDEDGTLDDQTLFTLGDGESHQTADFGYNGSGEIGDLVWLDLNGDGVQDLGEPGIPGQAVELTWAGPDGVLGTGDDQVYATITDRDGNYLFDHLPPGDYDVEVTGSITGAAVNTFDEDGDDDSHTPVTLGDGASHLTADFGYQGSAEIGDLVWLDLDGDGIADAGEAGLADVEVTVTWYGGDGVPGGGDDLIMPGYTTDADGNYLATGLPDGNYGVEVTGGVPTGLVNSADEDGDLDDHTDVSALTAGASHLTADFGYTGAGSIGDTIWWDLDGDGSQGAGEPGFSGIDVTLTWAGLDGVFGNADDAVFTATTDADGMYLFENLPPGDYQVVVDEADLPPGVAQSADPDVVLDGQSALTLGVAEANLDQDFGYRGDGSVGDFIWYDLNDDGVQDPIEPGVAGVTVNVTYLGPDGVIGGGDDVVFTTVTDANGNYTVPGLPSGFYEVTVDVATLPPGLTVTTDLDGGDPVSTLFTLGAAEDKTDVDYPVAGDASLSGTVWNDMDGDETIDTGEVGIPGVTVIVTWEGPDGPVVIRVVTDADGSWQLPTLPPGDYTVELDLATVPDGMVPTTGTDESVTLPVGGHEVVDFGLAEVVNLGSTVWIDTDGDGVIDPDETGIPNVMVNLYDENGLLVAITETDADGNYLFTDLLPGVYEVRLGADSLPDDVLATFDRDGTPDLSTRVSLTTGGDILDANFGFQVGLPLTGFAVDAFALWGVLMVLAGAILVGTSRIRRLLLT